MAGGTQNQYCSSKCPETFGPQNDCEHRSVDPGLTAGENRGGKCTVKDSSRCFTASSSRVTESQGEYTLSTRLWIVITLFIDETYLLEPSSGHIKRGPSYLVLQEYHVTR